MSLFFLCLKPPFDAGPQGRNGTPARLPRKVFSQGLLRKVYLCKYKVSVYLPPTPPFPAPESVTSLPPLDCLRFFEAAARHRSFVRAAEELGVTPPAVAHRIRMLESHLGAELFGRRRRGVSINRRGRAYYQEVRRILLDIRETTELHGDGKRFRGR